MGNYSSLIKALEEMLPRQIEVGVETGNATGGTGTILEDTAKNWEENRWVDGDIHIFKNGIEYVRSISANTANAVTFSPLPAGVTVASGDSYSIRRIVIPHDIVDRWTRQLGQVDLFRVLGADLSHGNPLIARLTDGTGFDVPLATRASEATLAAQPDFGPGQTAVDTTAVRLTAVSIPCKKGVLVKALSRNTGIVYTGKSGVTADTGYELTPGETVTIEVDDVSKVFAVADVAGQRVCWIGV